MGSCFAIVKSEEELWGMVEEVIKMQRTGVLKAQQGDKLGSGGTVGGARGDQTAPFMTLTRKTF